MDALPAGSTIGMLGGGQLGRMLAGAAAKLGFDTHVYAPEAGSPAARAAAAETAGAWDDAAALQAFAAACDVVTYEFENVPTATVAAIEAAGTPVRPGVKSLEMSQDRLTEKDFLSDFGATPPPYRRVDGPGDIAPALAALGGRGILKRRRHGYDGKGQARLKTGDDSAAAWAAVGEAPSVLEAFAPFEREVSAIVARGLDGSALAYDVSENLHEDGILRSARAPARVSDALVSAAQETALRLAEALDHVGVLAVEYFVMPDGALWVNEFAPRVHNSGHWTPEACWTGQFENHIRAVAGWPLGPVDRMRDVEMRNLLGEEALAAPDAFPPGASVTLYGKGEATPGRKMGHWVRRL